MGSTSNASEQLCIGASNAKGSSARKMRSLCKLMGRAWASKISEKVPKISKHHLEVLEQQTRSGCSFADQCECKLLSAAISCSLEAAPYLMAQPILRRPWFPAALGLPIVKGDGELFLSLPAWRWQTSGKWLEFWHRIAMSENATCCCTLCIIIVDEP